MPQARTARPVHAVVLAAGEGKRFKSARPKVLHDLCGRPLAAWALDAVSALKPARTIVVVGRAAESVEHALAAPGRAFVLQPQQNGTADAARIGLDALSNDDADVLVLPGDVPLLQAATLRRLVAHHRKTGAKATVLSARLPDPAGYGRIVRGAGNAVERIVEHRDASARERAIDEINTGVYVFDRVALKTALGKIDADNAQAEQYLTDVIGVLHDIGEPVEALDAAASDEVRGANDRAQLAQLATIMRTATAAKLMAEGVTIVDPAQTYIDPTVKVGRDTVIHPFTFLHGATKIGAHAEIGPSARITDSTVGDGARVLMSEVVQASIGPEASVGPFAYLRPGARLARRAKAGTFVEVKGSTIGEGSKVPHLSYVGDARIGRDVNVGAATVTVNYDSETKTKSRTVIGDGAKIGSDTMLIAPVKVGRNAVTGAGSVVTKDVAAGTVVYGNPARPARKTKTEKQVPRKGKKRTTKKPSSKGAS